MAEVIKFYEDNITLITEKSATILFNYLEKFSKDIIIYAIKLAKNKKSIDYIDGILNNWSIANIKTLEEAKNFSTFSEKFIPPSLEDIKKYIQEKRLSVNAEYFYNFYTEAKWIDNNGNNVNWKQKLITWSGYSNSPKHQKQEEKSNYNQREYTEEQLNPLYANCNFCGGVENVD